MIDFVREEKEGSVVLNLSGDLLIQHSTELSSALLDALGDADVVEIDVSSAAQVDISCLQLLCASHKMAMKRNKAVRIGKWSDAFMQAAKEACFLRHIGCVLDTKKECLWVKE